MPGIIPLLLIVWMSITEVPLGVYPVIAGKGAGVTVQAKVVPETFDESVTGVVWFPEQIL